MGLDLVELIMAVEEKFNIYIPDEEAGSVSTVGDLFQLVASKLEFGSKAAVGPCLTSAAFYRTRRGVVDALGLDRRDVRPSTPLEPILPWKERRHLWAQIQSSTGLKLPTIRHHGWIAIFLLLSGVVIALVPIREHLFASATVSNVFWMTLLGLCIGGLVIRFTSPLAVCLPHSVVTVGDLTKNVLAINYSLLLSDIGHHNRKDLWDAFCTVVVDQLGMKASQVVPDASLVDDLKID